MGLFIVIFGGAYWLWKWYSEKEKSDSQDRQRELDWSLYKIHNKVWEDKVVDEALEDELGYKLVNDRGFESSVIEEMRAEFGDMYTAYVGYMDDHSTHLRYLLAKQGKVKRSDREGIDIAHAGLKEAERTRWRREVNFVKWMRDELSKHGANSELLVIPYVHQNDPIPVAQLPKYSWGGFRWAEADYKTLEKRWQPSEEFLAVSKSEYRRVAAGIIAIVVAVIAAWGVLINVIIPYVAQFL